jgi:hypothetical protein
MLEPGAKHFAPFRGGGGDRPSGIASKTQF